MEMTNKLDLTQFNKTDIVKKLSKSKSEENLLNILEGEVNDSFAGPGKACEAEAEKAALKLIEATAPEKQKRGRKSKYNTPEERLEARRKQQKEYRLRKKAELEELKKLAQLVKA